MIYARAEESSTLKSEAWAVHASAETTTVEYHMRLAQATIPLDARQQVVIQMIQDHLDAVRYATTRRGRFSTGGLFDRWWGTSVMRAYQHLHAAKVFLVDLLPPEEIDVLVPYVIARATTGLNPGDLRRAEIKKLAQLPMCHAKRAGLSRAMRPPGPGVVTPPLGTEPTSPAGQLRATVRSVCPSGADQGPSSADVVVVAGLGLLGGALAAAIAIRKVRGTSTPYNVPLALVLLKVPIGSFTAVAGIILLAGEVVPGLSALDSQSQILAYALLLGYAQQIATRFLDDRAQTILNRVPSKEPDSRKSEPTSTAPAPSATGTAPEGPVPG